MKIVVLGGSPKGDVSATMQYVRYIQMQFPEHEFQVLQAAQPVQRLEKDAPAFGEIIDAVRSADGVLWAFPLYYYLVCSQYKRFIELLWERNAAKAFQEKYAASLSTSIHFFDHAAHNYIRAVSEDLAMQFVGSHSAGMQDLLESSGQKQIVQFIRELLYAIDHRLPMVKIYQPIHWRAPDYLPDLSSENRIATDRRIVVVADSMEGNTGMMVEKLGSCFESSVRIVDLSQTDIKGGCLGCLKCGPNNVCAYAGKDGFMEMFQSLVDESDVLLFAGEIKDRYLSSAWKRFFDRSFFRTHQPCFKGKQLGFVISGPLRQHENLREILSAYTELHEANLAGFVTDEAADSTLIDRHIEAFTAKAVRLAEERYAAPATFRKIGGMKVFRDDVFAQLRVIFKADHRYYKKNGIYDFPHRNILRRIMTTLFYWATNIPFVKRGMMQRFREFMIMPYRRVLAA